jgi:hypothetical protein
MLLYEIITIITRCTWLGVGVLSGWREVYPDPYPGIPYPVPGGYPVPVLIPNHDLVMDTQPYALPVLTRM